jgi:hypothetical protein
MTIIPYHGWRDLPRLLYDLALAGNPSAMDHDGLREISLPAPRTPAPKRSDPPNVKLGSLALQKVENLFVITAVTAGWLHFRACSFEQWLAVVGLVVGLAAAGPKLGTMTREGPRSLGALIAYWWTR